MLWLKKKKSKYVVFFNEDYTLHIGKILSGPHKDYSEEEYDVEDILTKHLYSTVSGKQILFHVEEKDIDSMLECLYDNDIKFICDFGE